MGATTVETHWPSVEAWDRMVDNATSDFMLTRLLDIYAPDDVPCTGVGRRSRKRLAIKAKSREWIAKTIVVTENTEVAHA